MTGRGVGVALAFERLLPPAVRELFALLTSLGDAGVLLAAVAVCYWFSDRRRGVVAIGGLLGAFSLTLALKGLFALPRPPAAIHVGHATGYGFPSGHAIGATVAWGLVAVLLDHDSRFPDGRKSVGAATVAVVALVASSRVVIGVHYLADVVVGVAVGLAYLAAFVRLVDWRPTRAFVVAALLASAALAANGLTADAVATVAGVLGAGATWASVEVPSESSVEPGSAIAGLAAFGAMGYAGNELTAGLSAVFVLNLVVAAGIVALPAVVGYTNEEKSARPT